jgi:hypothetical protein
MKPRPFTVLAAMNAPDDLENGCPMSIGALSNATALTILTTTYSPSGGQTSSLSKGDSKALAADPLLASLAAPTSSADFFVVARASQNAVMTTIVNTGLNKSNANPQALNFYESDIQHLATVFQSDNEMTSQQISDALYSGAGVQTAGTGVFDVNATMADLITAFKDSASYETQFASQLTAWQAAGMPNDGFAKQQTELANYSDAQISAVITTMQNRATTESEQGAEIAKAFEDHTLTIQKATDVKGLDYSQGFVATTTGNGGTYSISQSCNEAFMADAGADGKQHLLSSVPTDGNVMLYLSW